MTHSVLTIFHKITALLFSLWCDKGPFMCGLYISNHKLEFCDILWEASLTSADVHIVSTFWFWFVQSYQHFNYLYTCSIIQDHSYLGNSSAITIWKSLLLKASLRWDAHFISTLWLNDFPQSYCPFNFKIAWYRSIRVWAISLQPAVGIQWHLMKSFTNKKNVHNISKFQLNIMIFHSYGPLK